MKLHLYAQSFDAWDTGRESLFKRILAAKFRVAVRQILIRSRRRGSVILDVAVPDVACSANASAVVDDLVSSFGSTSLNSSECGSQGWCKRI
jgi:hypothetical protein